MNQEKIGKFIADCRKSKKITQAELAEKFGITDRAVSKWERGLSLPDASIMLDLCDYLDISVNELLSGERIMEKEYKIKAEEKLVEITKLKEQRDKELLRIEIVLGVICSVSLFTLIFIASFIDIENWLRVLLIILGIVQFMIGMCYGLRIEQVAGYYECSKCHHKYVPTYKSVFLAQHINRTRYMKCPNCGKKSWNKKVLTK